ncbi:hypothetical protein K474DRAFT_1710968 [Panus rudis PR-1116 ss-1]|nr:hypothetical protein K474DRAFT_1710968 [Panus rudis PR-1116 ss-1]
MSAKSRNLCVYRRVPTTSPRAFTMSIAYLARVLVDDPLAERSKYLGVFALSAPQQGLPVSQIVGLDGIWPHTNYMLHWRQHVLKVITSFDSEMFATVIRTVNDHSHHHSFLGGIAVQAPLYLSLATSNSHHIHGHSMPSSAPRRRASDSSLLSSSEHSSIVGLDDHRDDLDGATGLGQRISSLSGTRGERDQVSNKLLDDTQRANGDLISQNRELRARLAELQRNAVPLAARASGISRRSVSLGATPEPGSAAEHIKNHAERIKWCAKAFGVMQEPWITTHAFGRPLPNPPVTISQRCHSSASAETKLNGIVQDLFAHIPASDHEDFERHADYQELFVRTLNGNRPNHIRTVREVAPYIFGGDARYFTATFDRSTLSAFTYLLEDPSGTRGRLYKPRILYPVGKEGVARYLFQNEQLMKIGKCLLRGQASVTNPDAKCKPPTNGVLWGIREVTAGFISFCAILAIFFHSSDQSFHEKGKTSGIKYHDVFDKYKGMLLLGIEREEEPIQALFKKWNNYIFDGVVPAEPEADTFNEEDPEELDDLFAQMHEVSVVDDTAPNGDAAQSDPTLPLPSVDVSHLSRADGSAPQTASSSVPQPRPKGRAKTTPKENVTPSNDDDGATSTAPPQGRKSTRTTKGKGGKGGKK